MKLFPSAEDQVKKGKPTWKPANVIDIFDKDPAYAYRLLEKSPRNLAKKQREGWEIISGVSDNSINLESGYGRINDGKPLTSVLEGHDYVVAKMPIELKQSRDEYMLKKVKDSERALKKHTQNELGKDGAPTHGSISIEKNGVRTVIE